MLTSKLLYWERLGPTVVQSHFRKNHFAPIHTRSAQQIASSSIKLEPTSVASRESPLIASLQWMIARRFGERTLYVAYRDAIRSRTCALEASEAYASYICGARQCCSRIQMTNFNRRVSFKRSAPPNRNSKSACRDYKDAIRSRTCAFEASEAHASYICGARQCCSRIQMTNLNRRALLKRSEPPNRNSKSACRDYKKVIVRIRVQRCNSITNPCSRSVRSVRFVHLWRATMLFSNSNDELQSESVARAKRASEP